MNKSSVVAFFLSFFPGVGHFYLKRKAKGFIYSAGCIVPLFVGSLGSMVLQFEAPFFVGLLVAGFIWFISIFDMIITLLRGNHKAMSATVDEQTIPIKEESERIHTILLSLIPGLGHFYLGLMNRGLTFLISFFGLTTMIVFLTVVTNQGGFISFLGILPIIWIYNIFDTVQLLSKKHRGEELVDRTILEDFEQTRSEEGKKSRALATIISIFPGAGHMYLGLQKRGFQLMAGFLLAIYILDVLRLSFFLFLIPLIWFYSFFDALQKVSKHGEEDLEDIPVVSYLINHQKWVGIGLLVIGLFYMLDSIIIPVAGPFLDNMIGLDIGHWYYNYFETVVISILLIAGGIKLLMGSKRRKESAE
ncbi:hypothetical protein PY093_20255 [Cytobacillus sp. S13-E01]|uniref:hypothetical protein n=1 Tax=Cytobacillus sp. S13-E01 TaxID=3031326 RepID=UPI0023D8ADEE|nr:hypothetical protein [Cytobacillus sp. S13-E01]MDF0728949.1 hypothetical protein [Cytobacillus sp. S13-E01]